MDLGERRSPKKVVWRILMVLCIGVFAVSVFGITGTLVNARREKSTFDDLIEMAEEGNAEDSQDVSGDIAASGTEQQSDAGNGDTLGNSCRRRSQSAIMLF